MKQYLLIKMTSHRAGFFICTPIYMDLQTKNLEDEAMENYDQRDQSNLV